VLLLLRVLSPLVLMAAAFLAPVVLPVRPGPLARLVPLALPVRLALAVLVPLALLVRPARLALPVRLAPLGQPDPLARLAPAVLAVHKVISEDRGQACIVARCLLARDGDVISN